jgi:hypothetical protein
MKYSLVPNEESKKYKYDLKEIIVVAIKEALPSPDKVTMTIS